MLTFLDMIIVLNNKEWANSIILCQGTLQRR